MAFWEDKNSHINWYMIPIATNVSIFDRGFTVS